MKINLRDFSIESPYINRATRNNWVSFGRDNLYPSLVLQLANESPLQSAILNNKIKYMIGAGLKPTAASVLTPNLTESWSELLLKCMTDFAYLEAFAVQCILNEDGTKWSFYHTPIDQVRMGNYNDQNIVDYYYICADWKLAKKSNVVEIKAFGSESPKKGTPYLMYFKRYKPNELYYAIPTYMSCANWIMADIELSKYYNNYISNNFSANIAIQYPSEPQEEHKAEIYKMLQDAFSGADNAGSIVLLFGENGVVPTISTIESKGADLYNQVCDTVLKYIVSANRLTSPILAGLATSSGFSSKSDEILAAYTQYKLTVIDEARSFVLDKFNYFLQMNGMARVFEIQDYNLTKEFEGNTAENDEVEKNQTSSDSKETNKEEQIEEEDGK